MITKIELSPFVIIAGANEVEQTVFPHAFAMRKEMRHWKMLQLNPVELRKPSSILAKDFIGSDGSNYKTCR
ncbi:hypothetical protein [Candidatus Marithrix sp. Canyon 246]|uniref:hypothetical protein n=1 Tax=Candidatus Marithrix sp. Canyon 246 TaxID=1827136 RepID=UPI00084A2525|nr:hypothetical protein [Candidatus Marithrix sp. Canyon 246]